MRAGKLRHIVNVESLQGSTPDGHGNTFQAWTAVYSNVPASFKALSGKEVFTDSQTESQSFFQINIRFLPSITSAMRFTRNGRKFAIMNIQNVDERDIELVFQCREIFAE